MTDDAVIFFENALVLLKESTEIRIIGCHRTSNVSGPVDDFFENALVLLKESTEIRIIVCHRTSNVSG
jgi:hypothetical protein